MCEQSMVEKGQDPLDGQSGTGQQRKFAISNIYPALWESQIVSVPVGVHVCLNAAFHGLLGVLFWQTQSSADGQASSSWTLLLPCQLFTADDRQSRFPSGGIPSFSLPGGWWKKNEEKKKEQVHLAECNPGKPCTLRWVKYFMTPQCCFSSCDFGGSRDWAEGMAIFCSFGPYLPACVLVSFYEYFTL